MYKIIHKYNHWIRKPNSWHLNTTQVYIYNGATRRNQNFTLSMRGKRYRQFTIWYKTVINQIMGFIPSFFFLSLAFMTSNLFCQQCFFIHYLALIFFSFFCSNFFFLFMELRTIIFFFLGLYIPSKTTNCSN